MIGVTAFSVVLSASLFLFVPLTGGIAILLAGLLFGAASGGIGMASWAAFADAVAHHGRSREAWSYALFTASAKLSLALSGLAIGYWLSSVDYRGSGGGMLVTAMVAPSILAGAICVATAMCWYLAISGQRNRRVGS